VPCHILTLTISNCSFRIWHIFNISLFHYSPHADNNQYFVSLLSLPFYPRFSPSARWLPTDFFLWRVPQTELTWSQSASKDYLRCWLFEEHLKSVFLHKTFSSQVKSKHFDTVCFRNSLWTLTGIYRHSIKKIIYSYPLRNQVCKFWNILFSSWLGQSSEFSSKHCHISTICAFVPCR